MKPLVGIILGSDSDRKVMEKAGEVLDRFGIAFELEVMSAHRKPEAVASYAKGAARRGLKVLIAGAGMAAHLPGVLASHTTLPVIGVPLLSNALAGADALFSCVQMPPGVPVATVAIDGAKNAGVLAAQVLALSDSALARKLTDFKAELVGGFKL